MIENAERLKNELSPTPTVVEALKGTVSEPRETFSRKPGHEGKKVTVRIALDGPAMFGLTSLEDSREWAGIFNHELLTARYATHIATRLAKKECAVSPQCILDAMIISHAGRRQWDEASWYPDIAPNARKRASVSNETLGVKLIENKVPRDVFELVVALGHNVEEFSVNPEIFDSLDYKISIYVDHRISQQYEPLAKRMGDFFLGNFFDPKTVSPQLREEIYATMTQIIDRQKRFRLGEQGAKEVSLQEADGIAAQTGASPASKRLERKELMRLILQDADTEAFLLQKGIDPNAINDQNLPMSQWENQLRIAYVRACEAEIRKKSFEDFSSNSWWDKYAADLLADFKTKE